MSEETRNALQNAAPDYRRQLAWGPNANRSMLPWNDQSNHLYVPPIVLVIPDPARCGVLWDLARLFGLADKP